MATKLFILISAALFLAGPFGLLPTCADEFPTASAIVGRDGAELVTPVNQLITPAGLQVELPGMRPQAVALSPDGKILITSGLAHELVVLSPGTGEIRQRVPLPANLMPEAKPLAAPILDPDEKAQLSYAGLVFSPDGTRIYFSDINGEIKVFNASRDGKISPLFSIALPATKLMTRQHELPAGIAISPDGKKLYVAANLSNRLLELEAATGKVLRSWDVGVAPLNVVVAKNKIYVSNWGGRRPDAGSTTGPAGLGTTVRVDNRGIASEGSVSVIDLADGSMNRAPREIVVGPHACALALAPDGKSVVVASAGNDLLSVIDTRSDQIVETFTARQNAGDPFGAQPDALAFDASGKTLYCANASQNAIAVFHFSPRESKLLGLIPVGWFPSAIAFDRRGDKLCVANMKSIATKTQKAKFGLDGFGHNTKQYAGSLSLVSLPSKREFSSLTQKALSNMRYPALAQAKLPARPDCKPAPVPERVGEPSVFKHVIYIIKENRTYDQVLGDVKEGNGDPSLCNFGERVTPNQHKLVREFTLLDNTYCSGILSADGHNWADSALATDYLEREFAGWVRSYPCGGDGPGGRDALAYSPGGFIWDNALAHGKSVHNFGEFTTANKRWKNPTQKGKITFTEVWKDFTSGSNEIEYTCEPDIEPLRSFMEHDWSSWDLAVPDVLRAAKFIKRLKEFEKSDSLPALTILWLPNDHTDGTKLDAPTPAAMVADNDLALGQIVEAVSHSKFWKDTCIFAVEDDPQNGWDHVSGYRTTAYVVSAYTRRGAVVSTQYNQTSLLRTMELMLGLPPMNQFDATATPMFDCFTNVPNFAVYTVVTNSVPLNQMNPAPKQISDAQLRKDAIASARLPLSKPDQCNEDVLNRILWRATMGSKPYPEWAIKRVDDDD